MNQEKLENELQNIKTEYLKARMKFAPFLSFHEGYAVLLEETDELWDAIKEKKSNLSVRNEAIQVAAMALGIIFELTS